MNIPIHQFPLWVWTVLGVLSIVLSLSFLYKSWTATVLGKCHYWDGFLPLTIISPWLIHFKGSSENSLIKTKQGMVCHILVGPLLFFTALPLMVMGLDLTGLNGTGYTNLVLNLGSARQEPAIIYSAPISYRFPIIASSRVCLERMLNTNIEQEPGKVLLPRSDTRSAKDKYAR